MAAVVVAILDRDEWGANTDILVRVDAAARRLTWIPRDLWSPRVHDRINRAFARGGGKLLLAALRDLGFPARSVLCLRRAAIEAALDGITVTVPVTEPLDFWYPLHPTRPIEEGQKAISFRPPEEVLSGERLHQWIGARIPIEGLGSDLFRLRRQTVLLRALLAEGFDFRRSLRDPAIVRVTGKDPIAVLSQVCLDWRMDVFEDVDAVLIDEKAVLVLRPRPRPPLWKRIFRRIRARLAPALRRRPAPYRT